MVKMVMTPLALIIGGDFFSGGRIVDLSFVGGGPPAPFSVEF